MGRISARQRRVLTRRLRELTEERDELLAELGELALEMTRRGSVQRDYLEKGVREVSDVNREIAETREKLGLEPEEDGGRGPSPPAGEGRSGAPGESDGERSGAGTEQAGEEGADPGEGREPSDGDAGQEGRTGRPEPRPLEIEHPPIEVPDWLKPDPADTSGPPASRPVEGVPSREASSEGTAPEPAPPPERPAVPRLLFPRRPGGSREEDSSAGAASGESGRGEAEGRSREQEAEAGVPGGDPGRGPGSGRDHPTAALPRLRPGWLVPVVAGLAALLVGSAAVFAMYRGVRSDSQQEARGAPVATVVTGEAVEGAEIERWPSDRMGWTVSLASSESQAEARALAERATSRGLEAGILRTDDFRSLDPGFWVVYSGDFEIRVEAEQASVEAQSAGYADAYPLSVEP